MRSSTPAIYQTFTGNGEEAVIKSAIARESGLPAYPGHTYPPGPRPCTSYHNYLEVKEAVPVSSNTGHSWIIAQLVRIPKRLRYTAIKAFNEAHYAVCIRPKSTIIAHAIKC